MYQIVTYTGSAFLLCAVFMKYEMPGKFWNVVLEKDGEDQ